MGTNVKGINVGDHSTLIVHSSAPPGKSTITAIGCEADTSDLGDAKDNECLVALLSSDPEDDMLRIQDNKDDLIPELCQWVADDPTFAEWQKDGGPQVLCINGDAGKGKTMSIMSIISHLQRQSRSRPNSMLAYYFYETVEPRNNAINALRGLIYGLVVRQKDLICHVREQYDIKREKLFDGRNGFFALTRVLSAIMESTKEHSYSLVVDALDECGIHRDAFLRFIETSSKSNPRVKWLISSRHGVCTSLPGVSIILEKHESQVKDAVQKFVEVKVDELSRSRRYDETVKTTITKFLSDKAEGTFLWVALVCKELKNLPAWQAVTTMKQFPSGLNPLYAQMIERIGEARHTKDTCLNLLSVARTVFRPLHWQEMVVCGDFPPELKTEEDVRQLVELCGSFLVFRDNTIYFIHQSAKDYLLSESGAEQLPLEIGAEHTRISRKSQVAMSGILARDIYKLKEPGFLIDDIEKLGKVSLNPVVYSCQYWVEHIVQSWTLEPGEVNATVVDSAYEFLCAHFLHWIEALALTRKSILLCHLQLYKWSAMKVPQLLELPCWKQLQRYLNDAFQFTVTYREIIGQAPLQVYVSALLDIEGHQLIANSPPSWDPGRAWRGNQILAKHRHEVPSWASIKLLPYEGTRDPPKGELFSSESIRTALDSNEGGVGRFEPGVPSRKYVWLKYNGRRAMLRFRGNKFMSSTDAQGHDLDICFQIDHRSDALTL